VGEPLKRSVGFLSQYLKMNLLKRRWPWISLLVLVIVAMLIVLVLRYLDRAEKEFKESKGVRTTSGTVLRKEVFVCREPTCFYLGYGRGAEMKVGESQQRVYYQIDNFDQVSESRRSKALESERGLVQMYGPRSTYAVNWFDWVQTGSKLQVRYQCFSDGQIEIAGVEPTPPIASNGEIQQALGADSP
jgi:hypothetical protein